MPITFWILWGVASATTIMGPLLAYLWLGYRERKNDGT